MGGEGMGIDNDYVAKATPVVIAVEKGRKGKKEKNTEYSPWLEPIQREI